MRLGAAVSHAINIFSLLHLNCCIWITRWFLCDLKSPPGKPAECHPSAQQAALPALQPSTLPPCHPATPSARSLLLRSVRRFLITYFFVARFLFNYLYKLQTDNKKQQKKNRRQAKK